METSKITSPIYFFKINTYSYPLEGKWKWGQTFIQNKNIKMRHLSIHAFDKPADQVFDHQIRELVLTNYTLEQLLEIDPKFS